MERNVIPTILSVFIVVGFLLVTTIVTVPKTKSENAPSIYEVKYSEKEAKDWVTLDSFSKSLNQGEEYTYYINWDKPYDTEGRLLVNVLLNKPQYYSCSWYECAECSLYSYQYCSRYRCTVQSGTPYAICSYKEITQWKCTKEVTDTLTELYIRTATAKDGPDFDPPWNDVDYLEIPIGLEPWDNLANDPTELNDYQINIYVYTGGKCLYEKFEQYGSNAFTFKIYYEDGTVDETTLVAIFPIELNGDILGVELSFPKNVFSNKKIDRIEVWENSANLGDCYSNSQSFDVKVEFYGTKNRVDTQYVDKQGKEDLASQGYTCTEYQYYDRSISINASSCDVVRYTTDPSQDKQWINGYYYVYCDPSHECTPSPPNTVESGTHQESHTYESSDKQELYNYGCTDQDITCISYSSKTGSLSDYMNDKQYRDATNPSCAQWSSNTFNSTEDKTKTSGEPPYYSCTYHSGIFSDTVEGASCSGPNEDTVKTAATLTVQGITKEYYASTSGDEIHINLPASSSVSVTMKGATYTHISNSGNTIFSVDVQALVQNPYVVSESVTDVTPPNASFKIYKYSAVIYSPGDLYAKFYPRICSEFNNKGLKYRYATINNEPTSSDPCANQGTMVYLHKGDNQFVMTASSIDLKSYPTCTQKPNTCEEEDLYGCPEQCKVKSLKLVCPSTLRIKGEFGTEVAIPIKIRADSEGIVRISLRGKGVTYIPTVEKIHTGSNNFILRATSYLQPNQSKIYFWRVIVENPASMNPSYAPEETYCEIKVEVIPPYLYDIFKRPEFIVSLVIIGVGLYFLLTRKSKPAEKVNK